VPRANASIPLNQWHPSPIPVYVANNGEGVYRRPDTGKYGLCYGYAKLIRCEYTNVERAKTHFRRIVGSWQRDEADHNEELMKLARWQSKTFEQVKAEQHQKEVEQAKQGPASHAKT
jgi:hypothetical protein